MLIKGVWTFVTVFECWILLCAAGTWDCSLCTSSLPVVSSTSAGAGELDSFPGILLCALCPAINPVSPTACGFVLLPHLGWGSGGAPLAPSVLRISRGNGICNLQELTQSPNYEKSFWLSGLVLCYFACLEGNCFILQQCWLISLIQKAGKR